MSFYVDGDTGDNTNDGLSWANAKKNLDFLRNDDIGSIPREINAVVTVNVRGTVLSTHTSRHTTVENFR